MLKLHPMPEGERVNEAYAISLNGGAFFFPGEARVSAIPYNGFGAIRRPLAHTELAAFLSFESDEPVMVRVRPTREFQRVQVRPLSRHIQPAVEDGVITFTLDRPGAVVVEVDGYHEALHIFANPPAKFAASPQSAGVLYFGPGVHHPGVIEVKSGQTVFLDAGAVVYGAIIGVDVQNVRILGYGILDGSEEQRSEENALFAGSLAGSVIPKDRDGLWEFLEATQTLHGCIRFYRGQNIYIEGVICRDAASFCILPAACDNVQIENVKLIGNWRYNSDGIDCFNCSNVTIRRCFLRNFDDCVVLKGVKGWDERPLENVVVQDCVIWCDWGRALEIGAETCADEIRHILFENCDIVRGADVMLDIQNGDRAEVHDVFFRRIRCEYSADNLAPALFRGSDIPPYPYEQPGIPYLLVAETPESPWARDDRHGRIYQVRVEDIHVFAPDSIGMPPSRISGWPDAAHAHDTQQFWIQGLYLNEKRIHTLEEACVTCDPQTTQQIHFE